MRRIDGDIARSHWLPFFLLSVCCLFAPAFLNAQDGHSHDRETSSLNTDRSTRHEEGLRSNAPRIVAIQNGTVHATARSIPEIATVLIDGSKIVAVGKDVAVPAGAKIIDATGKHIYPGLIDGYVGSTFAISDESGTNYWNAKVTPQLSVAKEFKAADLKFGAHRKLGFTAALIAPESGIIRGQSALVLLGSGPQEHLVVRSEVAQHAELTISRGSRGGGYPNSPMGAYALARQAMYDAQWYGEAWQTVSANPAIELPEKNAALESLQASIRGEQMFVVETSNELFATRADRFAREFGLKLTILGSGNEYRRLQQVAGLNRPLILPVNFPVAPDVSSAELASEVSLEDLMHWDHAPENPARLAGAGVEFVFTTHGLKSKGDFLKHVRKSVKRGLQHSDALAAMTETPAKLFGVEDIMGSVEKNKLANLMITDGEWYFDKTKVVETWVDGSRFDFDQQPLRTVSGTWSLKGRGVSGQNLRIKGSGARLSGSLIDDATLEAEAQAKREAEAKKAEAAEAPADTGDADEQGDDAASDEGDEASAGDGKQKADAKKQSGIAIKKISLDGTRLSLTFRSDELGHDGMSQLTLLVGTDDTALGHWTRPDGTSISLSAKREAGEEESPEAESTSITDDPNDTTINHAGHLHQKAEAAFDAWLVAESESSENAPATFAVNYPLGAFGRKALPEQPKTVLIKNVTVWTLGEKGNLKNGAVLIGNGWIQSVYSDGETLPEADLVIDGKGGHVTPGIIDCHSHMATDSGVNESGQAITAEVRIGDMIDPDDMTIYRQLAGGVTSSNILHGSANPIGGQNQVIKLRWGADEAGMKFEGAPAGIKFALGENVKQSNRSSSSDRYPQTRMGVEQLIDDAFRAAIDYRDRWAAWEQDRVGLPPRRDLELDALAEIVSGDRWVHCHSYRQDEILALIRTLDSYNITIGSFQHILEGYKVADQMAEHGAMASAFADWWAYKYEVKDAIPYAGALMHRAGVVVSFNSDDGELGRHLNQEAAKAVRYGGVPEIEALKFVTLNPAKQLRIDDKVGSIEVGKCADIVLWNRHPLSNMATVEQTWIDGRKYFDRQEDQQSQKETKQMRVTLIQKILMSGEKMAKKSADTTDPANFWPRFDEFCHGHDGHGHDHQQGGR